MHFRFLAMLAMLFFVAGCDSLAFMPHKELDATPSDIKLAWEDVTIRTTDGEDINGWFIPGREPDREALQRTLLFFHGNAGNISDRLNSIQLFYWLGLDVLIIDYRGFGKSTGSPTVPGTIKDAEASWRYLVDDRHIAPDRIVIFGRSIGGGVAALLAGAVEPKPGGLILESTFDSLHNLVLDYVPIAPVSLLLNDYDSVAALKGRQIPLLQIHSRTDEIVPWELGQALYSSYQGPKRFLEIKGDHNNGFAMDVPYYLAGLKGWLSSLDTTDAKTD